jgi:hypothetical protein
VKGSGRGLLSGNVSEFAWRTFGLQAEILGSVEFVDAYLHFITYLHGAVVKCKLGHLNNYIFKVIPPPPFSLKYVYDLSYLPRFV